MSRDYIFNCFVLIPTGSNSSRLNLAMVKIVFLLLILALSNILHTFVKVDFGKYCFYLSILPVFGCVLLRLEVHTDTTYAIEQIANMVRSKLSST